MVRIKFTTTLKQDTIKILKIIASEKECHVNNVIEEAVEEYVKKRTLKKK
jgi:predicted transcriptional regulator